MDVYEWPMADELYFASHDHESCVVVAQRHVQRRRLRSEGEGCSNSSEDLEPR